MKAFIPIGARWRSHFLIFFTFPFDNSSSGDNLKMQLGPPGPGADGLCHQKVL